jgi:hypothetical protein
MNAMDCIVAAAILMDHAQFPSTGAAGMAICCVGYERGRVDGCEGRWKGFRKGKLRFL